MWRPEVNSLFQTGAPFFHQTSDIHHVQGHRCITREVFYEMACEGAVICSKGIKSFDILRLIEQRKTVDCIYWTRRYEDSDKSSIQGGPVDTGERRCKICRNSCMYVCICMYVCKYVCMYMYVFLCVCLKTLTVAQITPLYRQVVRLVNNELEGSGRMQLQSNL